MPIYDFDGSAGYQIGKVYDYDGSAGHQIGKVYDHDGTASHLIYSAETVYFDNGAQVGYTTYNLGNVNILNVGTTIYSQMGNYNGSGATTVRFAADISNISTLYVTITGLALNGNARLYFGISTLTGAAQPGVYIDSEWTRHISITTTGTHAINVSDISGVYQIVISMGVSASSYIEGNNYTCTRIYGT